MKQFQKYGVAAAVASVAAGVVAQEVSQNEAGDLAIIPYYTVEDGQNTGMHIINTTPHTQVVKVRLRRGSDSKDALDFNLVMSPYDEWTANIGAGGDTGVQVTTNDTTCTVPAFNNGVAQMPPTYAEGATEGYVEIIGMAQGAGDASVLAGFPASVLDAAAEHTADGVPLSCAFVREHFFRVSGANAGDPSVRGVHTSNLVSWGFCSAGAGPATDSNICSGGVTTNLAVMADTEAEALKVSYMITDSDGGLEAGDNAVMIAGFSGAPMMTNQQPISFGTAGIMQYDPLNFELPNLAYGAYASQTALRNGTTGDAALDPFASDASIMDGSMFSGLRAALDTNSLINDWAAFATDDATVATDWVVTLPGQYVMTNPICDAYEAYTLAQDACAATSATAASGIASGALIDRNELPLILASNTTSNPISGGSNLSLWDREEMDLNPPNPTSSDGLDFSPGGSAGDPTATVTLDNEVNVISFASDAGEGNVLNSSEDNGLRVVITVPDADRGWGQLDIQPANTAPARWTPNGEGTADDADIDPNSGTVAGTSATGAARADGYGGFVADVGAGNTMAVGFAVWERSFADQAGNYGRIIEHSTISSNR